MLETLRAKARAANNTDGVLSLDIGQHITRAAYLGGPHLQALIACCRRCPIRPPRRRSAALLSMLGQLPAVRPMLPQLEKAGENNQTDPHGDDASCRRTRRRPTGNPGKPKPCSRPPWPNQPRAQDLLYCVGQIREGAGDIDGAIAAYQTVVKARAFLGANSVVAASRLALARLYVKKGDSANAVKELDTLLAQWKDADTEFGMLKEVQEAREKIKN